MIYNNQTSDGPDFPTVPHLPFSEEEEEVNGVLVV